MLILMKNNDYLFSDIQNLCNAVSDWLIQKFNNPIETETISCVPVVSIYLYILSQSRKEDIRTGAQRHRAKKKKENKAR